MKKNLLFLFVLFQSLAFAQSWIYHPFPETGVWRSEHTNSLGDSEQYKVQLTGDTTIGGFTYRKLYTVNPPYISYAGAIRQDIPGKKVYFINTLGDETLFLNFDLSIGDTAFINNSLNDTVIVTGIDSALVGANYHKKFVLTGSPSSYTVPADLIEGVGYTSDFSWPYSYTFENSWQLLCFSEGGPRLFPSPDDFVYPYQCYLTVGIGEMLEGSIELSIMPNPVKDLLTLSVACEEGYSVEIMDASGKLISKTHHLAVSTKLDMSAYPAGVYSIRLSNSKESIVRKIVKQ